MKKTYQNPTMKIVKVETKRLMSGGSPAAPGMVGKNATGTAMGREGRNHWDDEDDFDE